MRRFFALLFFILATGSLPAGDLLVDAHYANSVTVTNRRVALKLQQPGAVVAGPWLVAGDFVVQYTDTNGITVFSNVLAGGYSLTIYGSPERSFAFGMPDTNGTVSAAALIGNTNTTPVYYTASQVDLLLAALGVGSSPNALTNGDTRDLVFNGELLVDQAATFNSSVALLGAFTTFGGSQNWINNNGQMRLAGGAFTNDAVGNVRAASFTASSGGFIGDGSQLTGLPSPAGATNVYYGGSVTTSNVVQRIASGERTNANIALAYGGIQASTAVYGQSPTGNYNYRSGLEFWPAGWDGTLRDYANLDDHPVAFVRSLTNWGGSTGPNGSVLHIGSGGNIRIEALYGETWWGQCYITVGNEDANAPPYINDVAFSVTNGADGIGYSLPLNFSAKGVVGGTKYTSRPGIMGWWSGLNSGPSTYDGVYAGILRFYSRTPTADRSWRTFGADDWSTPIEVGQTSTNGWRLYGPVNLQQRVTYAVGTNVYLDFNGPSSQTIYLQSGVLTNFIQLTNVNVYRGTTNFEQRTFRLIAGGLDRPMRYPAWSTVSETGSTTPSSLLTAQKVMLLRLTAWGDGDTNVVCEFGTGTDATWAFDSDAAAFFTAASISDATQKGAVDTMTKALKGLNLWTNFVALWPMVGGNATAHSLNLVNSALYPWTWVAAPTQDGNGVTGNGSSQYGTTTFNWSTHMGGQALTNFHAAVYVRTTTPTDGGAFIGGRNGSIIGVGITREGASAGVRGVMSTLGPNAVVNLSTDLRGPIILTRANSFAAFDMATRLTAITTTSSDAVSVPSITPYLLAYNYNASASSFSSANIAFASVGWGFTAAQLAQVKAVIENYEAALSRNVP